MEYTSCTARYSRGMEKRRTDHGLRGRSICVTFCLIMFGLGVVRMLSYLPPLSSSRYTYTEGVGGGLFLTSLRWITPYIIYCDVCVVLVQLYLTFHSYGQYILYPWGYDALDTPDWEDLNRVSHTRRTYTWKRRQLSSLLFGGRS